MMAFPDIEALINASYEALRAGNIAEAIRHAKTALTLAPQTGDGDAQGLAAAALAYAHLRLAHYATVKEILTQALPLTHPESVARAEILLVLGIRAAETDDLVAAERYFQQVIDLGRQLGAPRLVVRGLHCLAAGIYTPRGEFALAISADEEAFSLTCKYQLPEVVWSQLTNLCWTCWLTGRRDQTLRWLAELRDIAPPNTLAEGYWHLIHGELAREEGDFTRAADCFAICRTIAEAGGLPELDFLLRLGLARLCRATGDAPTAYIWAADALSIAERMGYHHFQGRALIERGRAAWALEDAAQAEADFHAALELLTPLRTNFELARIKLLLAELLHAQGAPEAETVWIEAATRILNGGYTFWLIQEATWVNPLLAAYLNTHGPAGRAAERLRAALDKLPPPPLRILTLGGFQVFRGGIPVPAQAWQRRKTRQLLLYLALRRAPVARDELLDALWPDLSPDSAAMALNTTFSELRRILEPQLGRGAASHYLERDDETLALRITQGVWCDVWAFEQAVQGGVAAIPQALTLYRGDFLPEDPYLEWALHERERLRSLYLNTLMTWLDEQLAAQAWSEALLLTQHILAREPWLEEVWRVRMRCLNALGRRSEALHAYQECVRALRAELDAAPGSETRALYEQLQAM